MLPPLVLGDHKGIRNLVSDMCFLNTDSGEKSKKCKQCNYASSDLGNLRTHLKMHSREKYKKCNQCDYAFSRAGNLRIHWKTHSGEKTSILCNQCDYALCNLLSDLIFATDTTNCIVISKVFAAFGKIFIVL